MIFPSNILSFWTIDAYFPVPFFFLQTVMKVKNFSWLLSPMSIYFSIPLWFVSFFIFSWEGKFLYLLPLFDHESCLVFQPTAPILYFYSINRFFDPYARYISLDPSNTINISFILDDAAFFWSPMTFSYLSLILIPSTFIPTQPMNMISAFQSARPSEHDRIPRSWLINL